MNRNTTIPFTGRSRTITENRPSTSSENSNSRFKKIFSNIFNHQNESIELEEVVDINQNYDQLTNDAIQSLKPKKLYGSNLLRNTGLISTYKETAVSCLEGQVVKIPLITEESVIKLKRQQYKLVHLGVITVTIKGLIRKGTGTKVMVVIQDDRWNDLQQGTIALCELDMTDNKGAFYCSPEYQISIDELVKHIKVCIQTKGFEDFKGENLLVHIGFCGKATNNMSHKFKINMKSLVEIVTSKGVKFITPKARDPTLLAGLEWDLQKLVEGNSSLQPNDAILYTNNQGRQSVRFTNYKSQNMNVDSDTDEIEEN